jgi:hypothetical protein
VTYYNWQKATKADALRFRKASPNLVQLKDHLIKVWGGSSVGIYSKRAVRGGTAPSSHSFGAALDWRHGTRRTSLAAMAFMIKNHEKLGVQMIIDYVGCRIWVAGRGWKPAEANAKTGMGTAWAKWVHVETTKDAWSINTPILDR